MHAASDFRTIRAAGEGTVEQELIKAASYIMSGCFKVVSISASKKSFVLVCSTALSSKELKEKGFGLACNDTSHIPELLQTAAALSSPSCESWSSAANPRPLPLTRHVGTGGGRVERGGNSWRLKLRGPCKRRPKDMGLGFSSLNPTVGF
ncbi:hypothetical protein NA56DRAFT_209527 [Hyaloscypha hepaticicola]|uniref:Uncharacterized protein n=1 Tax=Hyaloscypha hepaticicola TaxID=2082293 RepID=A0A2J6PXY6_9HELO|nr:hypothetical protein NA56DRAFT_209527 [Hyaloscypha hepaticicola]